jgi:putative MATE family efflux protein
MASTNARLTTGPVGRQMIGMTVPVLFGILMMMSQAFVDAYFIGRVGDAELAALGFAFPILLIVSSVAIGLGAGTSSVVARAIGANNHHRAKRLVTDSLILSFFITVVVCAVGFVTIDPLFRLLGAPQSMLPLIAGYMHILYVGVPFVVVGMVGMSSMRATGDTRLPSMLMVLIAIINVILDPILIFGLGPAPEMGLNGAAMAALIARGTIFVGMLYFLRVRFDMLSFRRAKLAELKTSWGDILHVGIPAAGTNVIIPIALAVITAMLARYGPEAVAGFGVASRIEALMLVMFYALSATIGPFVGQNLSAGKPERIFRALRLSTGFCLVAGLLIAGILAVMSKMLPALFSDNPAVTDVTTLFLLVAPIGYGTYGMVMVMNASFNGMGKPMPAVFISVARMAVVYVPLAFLLDHWYGIAGIFAAYTVTNIFSGILAYVWANASVNEQCEKYSVASMTAQTDPA